MGRAIDELEGSVTEFPKGTNRQATDLGHACECLSHRGAPRRPKPGIRATRLGTIPIRYHNLAPVGPTHRPTAGVGAVQVTQPGSVTR
jgi:hypothetical protein